MQFAYPCLYNLNIRWYFWGGQEEKTEVLVSALEQARYGYFCKFSAATGAEIGEPLLSISCSKMK
jgi:hypothetical protein